MKAEARPVRNRRNREKEQPMGQKKLKTKLSEKNYLIIIIIRRGIFKLYKKRT